MLPSFSLCEISILKTKRALAEHLLKLSNRHWDIKTDFKKSQECNRRLDECWPRSVEAGQSGAEKLKGVRGNGLGGE